MDKGEKVTELTASSVLNYQTRHQSLKELARREVPAIRAEILQAVRSEFSRYCTICGQSFKTQNPGQTACSEICRTRFTVESTKWAKRLLRENVPKALDVLTETPLEERVYFIRGASTGAIKIGYTTDLNGRFNALQGASSETLEVLCAVNGDRELEARFHKRFADCRIRGEWFEATDELLAFIAQIEACRGAV